MSRAPTAAPPPLTLPLILLQALISICLTLSLSPGYAWAASSVEKIPVVASILPLGDFCQQIGGDRVQVQVLIPPGASPHVFEPSPAAVARATRARLFVYVGAGLDPWAERLLRSRQTRHLMVVEAVRGLPLLKETAHHAEPGQTLGAKTEKGTPGKRATTPGGETSAFGQAQGNPHVWLDPVLAQDICRRIAGALIQVDPAHREVYEANLHRYLKELADLHREIQQRVAAFRLREFVSFHPSFSYFAQRYHLREVGVIEVSPGREPTPRHIQQLVSAIRRYHVRVVFAEPQFNPRVAEVIAREAGVKVLILDPIGGRPPYGSDYLRLMRSNLAALGEAMG